MLLSSSRFGRAALVALALTLVLAVPADARRGGSFGSRGLRTYSSPRATSISPGYVAPVQRTMTPPPAYTAPRAFAPTPPRSGLGGFGGGLLGGLVAGGLIGGLMGHGWGGGWGGGHGGGGLISLIQLIIIGGLIWWVIGMFRRRSDGAATTASAFTPGAGFGGGYGAPSMASSLPGRPQIEFNISPSDEAAFGQLLVQVQDAFGHEDFARLRELTTPEVMSYLSEELSENSVKGMRNEVSGTRLLQAEISEAWREGPQDYVTAALRYEGFDLMRNRTTGEIVAGDPERPTEARELWTFVRQNGGPWKLSAIQAA